MAFLRSSLETTRSFFLFIQEIFAFTQFFKLFNSDKVDFAKRIFFLDQLAFFFIQNSKDSSIWSIAIGTKYSRATGLTSQLQVQLTAQVTLEPGLQLQQPAQQLAVLQLTLEFELLHRLNYRQAWKLQAIDLAQIIFYFIFFIIKALYLKFFYHKPVIEYLRFL